jgi:hypothetical protein
MSRSIRPSRLTRSSDLSPIILRMIATQSLAAFAQSISPTPPAPPVRGPGAVGGGNGQLLPAAAPSGRTLEAVPPPPPKPLPRGSLLDVRV